MKNFTLYITASILLGVLVLIPQYANAQVLKIGSCPSGWSSSGKYCVAGLSAKGIMIKVGFCPSGWSSSGNYCVKH